MASASPITSRTAKPAPVGIPAPAPALTSPFAIASSRALHLPSDPSAIPAHAETGAPLNSDCRHQPSSRAKAEIAKGPEPESLVLVSLVRSQKLQEITGPVDRDERAVRVMSDAYRTKTMATARVPATFPD